MQEISGLRSLIALQIFYHHSDKCLTMLRELRSCVVDHILHFSHLRIQYVSMCYSVHGPIHNYAVHIMTPFRIGLNPCAFTGGVSPTVMAAVAKGKTNIIPTAEQSPSTPSPMEQSPEDSDGEVRQVGRLNMVIKGVKIHDISGIKMWEKENWSVKL